MYIIHKYKYILILWNKINAHISFPETTKDKVISRLFSLSHWPPGITLSVSQDLGSVLTSIA